MFERVREPIKCRVKEKSDKAPLVARKHPIRRLQTSAVGVCVCVGEYDGGMFMLEY